MIDWRTWYVDAGTMGSKTVVAPEEADRRAAQPDRFTEQYAEFYAQPALSQKLLPASTQ